MKETIEASIKHCEDEIAAARTVIRDCDERKAQAAATLNANIGALQAFQSVLSELDAATATKPELVVSNG